MLNIHINNSNTHLLGCNTYIHADLKDQDLELLNQIGRGKYALHSLMYKINEETYLFLYSRTQV